LKKSHSELWALPTTFEEYRFYLIVCSLSSQIHMLRRPKISCHHRFALTHSTENSYKVCRTLSKNDS